MTAEKVLKITKKEIKVINDLIETINVFMDEETASTESFENILRDIVEGIYYEQSVTDEYKIKIITGEEDSLCKIDIPEILGILES